MNKNFVKYAQLTQGDEFQVADQLWETLAIHMPGDDTVQIWARVAGTSFGAYETFYRRTDEMATCPVYGN